MIFLASGTALTVTRAAARAMVTQDHISVEERAAALELDDVGLPESTLSNAKVDDAQRSVSDLSIARCSTKTARLKRSRSKSPGAMAGARRSSRWMRTISCISRNVTS